MVKSLLDKSATVNIVDDEGATPLHLACERGLLANVKLLVEYGAHINMQTTQVVLNLIRLPICYFVTLLDQVSVQHLVYMSFSYLFSC